MRKVFVPVMAAVINALVLFLLFYYVFKMDSAASRSVVITTAMFVFGTLYLYQKRFANKDFRPRK